jgi:hypothetical protein
VARRGRDLFCVLNTTPLVKVDSNRLWASRQESSDAARAGLEGGEWPMFDPTLAFREVDEVLARHLKLGPAPAFDLVGPDDVPGLERTARRCDAPAGRAAEWRKRLADGGIAWVPKARTLLLGHAPIHRLAEEAMRRRLEAPEFPWQLRLVRLDRAPRDADVSKGARARFHRRLRIEGAAFLASRLVNPDRKCRLFADWNRTEGGLAGAWVRAWIRAARRQPGRLPFLAAGHPFWTIRAATRREVARAVGMAWGWHFFQAWTAGHLSWDLVTALVDPVIDEAHDARVIVAGVATFPEDVDRHSKESLL